MIGAFFLVKHGVLMAGTIEEKIDELVRPLIEASELILWGVRYRGGRDSALLQIFIDSKDGVSADTCGDITNMLSPALDAADIIAPAYILEVSSPGFDRILFTLDQARAYIGKKIKAEVRIPVGGRRKFEGVLEEVTEDNSLKINDKISGQVEIAFSNISVARLVPEFSQTGKKPQ